MTTFFGGYCPLENTNKRTVWRTGTHLVKEHDNIIPVVPTVFSHDTDIQVVGLWLSSSSQRLTRTNIVTPFENLLAWGAISSNIVQVVYDPVLETSTLVFIVRRASTKYSRFQSTVFLMQTRQGNPLIIISGDAKLPTLIQRLHITYTYFRYLVPYISLGVYKTCRLQ